MSGELIGRLLLGLGEAGADVELSQAAVLKLSTGAPLAEVSDLMKQHKDKQVFRIKR